MTSLQSCVFLCSFFPLNFSFPVWYRTTVLVYHDFSGADFTLIHFHMHQLQQLSLLQRMVLSPDPTHYLPEGMRKLSSPAPPTLSGRPKDICTTK